MDVKNITGIVSILLGICALIILIAKYKHHKTMEDGPFKRLAEEAMIIQGWLIVIFILTAMEKIDFIIAHY